MRARIILLLSILCVIEPILTTRRAELPSTTVEERLKSYNLREEPIPPTVWEIVLRVLNVIRGIAFKIFTELELTYPALCVDTIPIKITKIQTDIAEFSTIIDTPTYLKVLNLIKDIFTTLILGYNDCKEMSTAYTTIKIRILSMFDYTYEYTKVLIGNILREALEAYTLMDYITDMWKGDNYYGLGKMLGDTVYDVFFFSVYPNENENESED